MIVPSEAAFGITRACRWACRVVADGEHSFCGALEDWGRS